jgi:hypothetical protein
MVNQCRALSKTAENIAEMSCERLADATPLFQPCNREAYLPMLKLWLGQVRPEGRVAIWRCVILRFYNLFKIDGNHYGAKKQQHQGNIQ